MMELNLQLFGGRGASAGGSKGGGAGARTLADNLQVGETYSRGNDTLTYKGKTALAGSTRNDAYRFEDQNGERVVLTKNAINNTSADKLEKKK